VTEEQAALLQKTEQSIAAARLLSDNGFHDAASSRAYFAMFYAATAVLLEKNLRFKKHSAVHAAFGRDIARPGILPVELHGWLLDAAKARAVSDYRIDGHITLDETATHIERAEQFLAEVTAALEKAPENDA
jgi:uncharacterized protein (UPF0332 family)